MISGTSHIVMAWITGMVSPAIHQTASKPGYGPALGTQAIAQAARTGIAVVALGGMTADNAAAARQAGAPGIAAMGGVMRAANPAAVIRTLLAGCSV